MKKLYVKLSECELNLLKNYAQKSGAKTYRKSIEKLIEEDAVSILCIISAIEKNLRKTAVNYRQMKHYIQSADPTFDKQITDVIYPAIQDISAFTSSVLCNIQRGVNDRFEVQIRIEDDTKETLKQMKKSGCFRTYDALLRFMLTTRFEVKDIDTLESSFSIVRNVGHLFNRTAHLYNTNHCVDISELMMIMPKYKHAINVVVGAIGG